MLTFLIVVAAMLLMFLIDFPPLLASGPTKAIVFYSVVMSVSVIIIALHCFWGNLAGV